MPTLTLSPRAKSIALFVSIAINVLLISAIAAQALSAPGFKSSDRSAESRVERLAKKLPDTDADKLRKAFAARAGDLPAARAELKAARDAFRQALKAEPFDPARLEKSLVAMDVSRAKIKQIMRTAVAAAAAEMTAEGRGRLAEGAKRR